MLNERMKTSPLSAKVHRMNLRGVFVVVSVKTSMFQQFCGLRIAGSFVRSLSAKPIPRLLIAAYHH
jgi:hypothetical protein